VANLVNLFEQCLLLEQNRRWDIAGCPHLTHNRDIATLDARAESLGITLVPIQRRLEIAFGNIFHATT